MFQFTVTQIETGKKFVGEAATRRDAELQAVAVKAAAYVELGGKIDDYAETVEPIAPSSALRIVRRAYGEYTDIASVPSGLLVAWNLADDLERANNDGEYFVRGFDEPNWRPGTAYQSGFDWL